MFQYFLNPSKKEGRYITLTLNAWLDGLSYKLLYRVAGLIKMTDFTLYRYQNKRKGPAETIHHILIYSIPTRYIGITYV